MSLITFYILLKKDIILSIFNKGNSKYVIEAFNKGILPMSFISSSYFSNDEIMNRLNINNDVKKILKKHYVLPDGPTFARSQNL